MAKKKLINNYDEGVLIEGSSSKDTLNNYADNVTIDAGAGNDTIYNEGSNALLDGGKGKNLLTNYGVNVAIRSGSGKDSVANHGDYVYIDVGAGNDRIVLNDSDGATINAGKGKDTIFGSTLTSEVYQYAKGDGNDVIYGFDRSDIINITKGDFKSFAVKNDDLILKIGSSKITLKSAADTPIQIRNVDGSLDTINYEPALDDTTSEPEPSNINVTVGTDGDDTIYIHNAPTSVDARNGNDFISNYLPNITVLGGEGDDYILNRYYSSNAETVAAFNTLSVLDGNDGDDSINNNFINTSISGGTGNDIIYNNGSNSTVESGSGDDRITNEAPNVSIISGAGDDSISNILNASLSMIDAGDGNDSVFNSGSNSAINSGAGNDSIYNGGSSVTIRGGAGNDTISNSYNASLSVIDGGAGDDSINTWSNANFITVRGGRGNDNINGAQMLIYSDGDGDDTVTSFSTLGTIQILDGTLERIKYIDGGDVIFHISDGSITFPDLSWRYRQVGDTLTVLDSLGNTVDHNFDTILGGTSEDNIYNRDAFVVIVGDGSDRIENSVEGATIDAGNGDDSIFNDSIASSAVIDAGIGNDTINNRGSKAFINGSKGIDRITNYGSYVSIDAGDDDDTVRNEGSTSSVNLGNGDNVLTNYASNVTITGGDGNNTIANGNYPTYNASLTFIALGDGDNSINNWSSDATIRAGAGNDTVTSYLVSGGSTYPMNVLIDVGDGDNRVRNGSAGSTIRAGLGDDSINNFVSNVMINVGGGNDTVVNESAFVSVELGDGDDLITNKYTASLSVIDVGNGNDTVTNLSDHVTIHASDGDNVLINGVQGEYYYDHFVEIQTGAGNDIIANYGSGGTIQSGDGDDSIFTRSDSTINGGAGNDTIVSDGTLGGGTINGGAGNDSIVNRGSNVTIIGGAGNDTISNSYNASLSVIDGGDGDDYIGGSWTNTVRGGRGNDTIIQTQTIIYEDGDGNDIVTDSYRDSTLQILGGTLERVKYIEGNDVIFRIGDGSITFPNRSRDYRRIDDNLIVFDSLGNTVEHNFDTIFGSALNDTIYNYKSLFIICGDGDDKIENSVEGATIDAGSGNDSIDINNWNRASSVMINAGDGNDAIAYEGSNVTVFGGEGDDRFYGDYSFSNVILVGGDGNDTISDDSSNSTIFGGEGDDSIDNDGSLVAIDAGDGNNYISASWYSTVLTGDGNDRVLALRNSIIRSGDGDDTIYGFGSLMAIDAGDGDDFIYNYDDSNSTLNAGDGNDTVDATDSDARYLTIDLGDGDDSVVAYYECTINGGTGNDTVRLGFDSHYYYSDGNDVILNYYGEYDNIHFTEGQINSAYVDGNDVVVQIGSGSLRFADASDTTINIIDPQGQVYQIYDLPSINNPVNPTGNQPVDANQSSLDDQTITGTDRNDSIASGGNNVSISALDGDDTIQNYYFDSRHTLNANNPYGIYTGDNVTINAGRGNDLIVGNSSRREIYQYASGDGDDTISGYNPAFLTSSINANGSLDTMRHDGDIINITEGRLLRASLDGSDVVMIVGTGSMRLTDVKGKEITVVEDEGATFTFTNKYTRQPYVQYVGANVHMTATHEEGESVVAANGTAFIDTYHLLDTDANGNINRLVMTNREYKMTTPDSPIAVNVEGANTQNMAVVIGTADFSWTGDRLNIVAASDNPISVDVESNTVTVRGSIGNDSLKSSGHSVTLEGNDGDDTLVGGAGSDTFIFSTGDGNDMIVNYAPTDLIRLRSGRIDSAKLDGNDVVMSLDGGSIRLKDAKGKDITFIGTNGKEKSFKNNYRGASDEMLSSAKDFLDRLENGLAAKLKEKASRFKPKEELFAELKGQLNMDSSIPDKVYKEIVEAIADKLKTTRAASSWTYTANDEQEFVEEIYSELESGLSNIPSRSVTVDGVVYKISFPLTLSFAGYSSNFIDVEHGGKTEHLSFSTKDKQAIADYNTKLIVLECEVGIDMYKDILGLIVGNSKLMEGILTSGQEEALSMLKKVFGNDVLKEALIPDLNWKELGKKVIRLLDDGKKIISAAETIEEMKRAYDDMEEQADYDSFIRLGNSIAKTLGVEKVSTGGIGDWISGWFNELPASDADYWFTQSDTTSDISALDSIIDNGMPDNKNAVANQLIRTTAENIFPVRETVSIEGLRHKKSYGAK